MRCGGLDDSSESNIVTTSIVILYDVRHDIAEDFGKGSDLFVLVHKKPNSTGAVRADDTDRCLAG